MNNEDMGKRIEMLEHQKIESSCMNEYMPTSMEERKAQKQYQRYQWKRKWLPFYRWYSNRKARLDLYEKSSRLHNNTEEGK